MAQVYFHCSNAQGVLLDKRGTEVDGLAEARARAAQVVAFLIASPGPEDWRQWVLHASDDLGEELFAVPFAAMLGRPQ